MVKKSASKKTTAKRPAARKKGGSKKSAAKKPSTTKKASRSASHMKPGRSGIVKILLSVLIWFCVAFSALIGWFAWDIPDPEEAVSQTLRAPGITVLAADGAQLMQVGDLYGESLTLDQIPPYLPQALLATEDRRFYSHPGIDVLGILRALVTNIVAGEIRQGGSTLTQQLAKNLFLSRDRTLRRKVQEALLSFWLEANYSKDELLEIYLNRVYLGAGTYGIDAASNRYFGISARHVSPWQAAVLAGMPKAPSALNPFRNPAGAAERAREVLDDMVRAGFLSQREASELKQDSVRTISTDQAGAQTRWLAEWALDRAADILGGVDRDIVVTTTLQPTLQQAAERAASKVLPSVRAKGATQLAFIATRPDGAVVALLGGADRSQSSFNRAVHGMRQPGSVFKLFVYLAGFESGLTPDSEIDDRIAPIEGWSPRNAGAGHRGLVTIREGVARSINTVAVAVSETAGRQNVIDMARRLGVTAPLSPDPSIALGVFEVSPMEIAGAYATIANRGRLAVPYVVAQIKDEASGNILYQHDSTTSSQVISGDTIAAIDDVLQASVAWGTSRNASIADIAPGVLTAGKTGTTQDYRDAWFAGYTPDMVGVVWIGNDDGTPTDGIYGGSEPAQLWRGFMVSYYSDLN